MTTAPARRPSQSLIAVRQLRRAIADGGRSLAAVARRGGSFAWRYLGPVLASISMVGRLTLGAAIASFLISIILGWVEFTFLGATLLGGLLVAACFSFGRATYAVTIELNPRRVTAGERGPSGRPVSGKTSAGRPQPTRKPRSQRGKG